MNKPATTKQLIEEILSMKEQYQIEVGSRRKPWPKSIKSRIIERKGLRVFVYRERVDMRCGFERLHSLCIHQMNALMDQGHVYFFFGKNRKRVKLLVFDGTGLVLIAKRIERGYK